MNYLQPLNSFYTPPTTSQGIPIINKCEIIPDLLWNYRLRSRRPQTTAKTAVHFFMDDWRFENLWRYPTKSLSYIKSFDCAIGPDFSIYLDWAEPLKVWNTYRNRWITAFWQSQGIRVIPCINWADEESYNYCFDGIPEGSVVAIASMCIRKNSESEQLFMKGISKLFEQVNATKVLVYGTKFKSELESLYRENLSSTHIIENMGGRGVLQNRQE